jgi:hypothetical protein
MKREHRYTVLKYKDVKKYLNDTDYNSLVLLLAKVADGRVTDGKPELSCVVVESDWPEYEPVWKMIEARVNGIPTHENTYEGIWNSAIDAAVAEIDPALDGLISVIQALKHNKSETACQCTHPSWTHHMLDQTEAVSRCVTCGQLVAGRM